MKRRHPPQTDAELIEELTRALVIAERNIKHLCQTVNVLAKSRKVYAEDYHEHITNALALAKNYHPGE